MSQKEAFIKTWERECQLTAKIMRAFPADKLDLKPHAKLRTARDLMWVFVGEAAVLEMAMSGEIDMSAAPPPPPPTLEEIIAAYEMMCTKNKAMLLSKSEESFLETTHFPIGKGTIGEFKRIEVAWITVHDMIHHRGQLSIYLRLADGKLPSIYGPTADEPWH